MDFDKLMEYQDMMQNRLRTEQKTERKIELLSIINQMTIGPNNIVQKEEVMIEATRGGFSADEIEDIIDILIKENIIYESSPGFIKKR